MNKTLLTYHITNMLIIALGMSGEMHLLSQENNERAQLNLNKKLLKAAQNEKIKSKKLKFLLREKADPNFQFLEGSFFVTPFHCLFFNEKNIGSQIVNLGKKLRKPKIKHVKLFLEYKANINQPLIFEEKSLSYCTLLSVVSRTRQDDVSRQIKFLVENKADFNQENYLLTPFYTLTSHNEETSLDLIKYALENRADPNACKSCTYSEGFTTTPFVAFLMSPMNDEKRRNGIKIFLEYKADLNIVRKGDQLPVVFTEFTIKERVSECLVKMFLQYNLLNPCLFYPTQVFSPRWKSLPPTEMDKNGEKILLFEMLDEKETVIYKNMRNDLVSSMFAWIEKPYLLSIKNFLLSLKVLKNSPSYKIPKAVINNHIIKPYIYDFALVEEYKKKVYKMFIKDWWSPVEGGRIKGMLLELIDCYEKPLRGAPRDF